MPNALVRAMEYALHTPKALIRAVGYARCICGRPWLELLGRCKTCQRLWFEL